MRKALMDPHVANTLVPVKIFAPFFLMPFFTFRTLFVHKNNNLCCT